MQFEKLKPMLYANELKERLAILKQTLLAIRRKSENMPQGHLKVVQKKNHTEYYHLSETGSSCGKVAVCYLAGEIFCRRYSTNLNEIHASVGKKDFLCVQAVVSTGSTTVLWGN